MSKSHVSTSTILHVDGADSVRAIHPLADVGYGWLEIKKDDVSIVIFMDKSALEAFRRALDLVKPVQSYDSISR